MKKKAKKKVKLDKRLLWVLEYAAEADGSGCSCGTCVVCDASDIRVELGLEVIDAATRKSREQGRAEHVVREGRAEREAEAVAREESLDAFDPERFRIDPDIAAEMVASQEACFRNIKHQVLVLLADHSRNLGH